MKIGAVNSENHFLLNGMVKTRSHMVQMKVYIGKTYVKHCFVVKHHFRAPKSIRVVPSESENHFLSIETIKNRSRMVKMKPYIGFYRKLSIFFPQSPAGPMAFSDRIKHFLAQDLFFSIFFGPGSPGPPSITFLWT